MCCKCFTFMALKHVLGDSLTHSLVTVSLYPSSMRQLLLVICWSGPIYCTSHVSMTLNTGLRDSTTQQASLVTVSLFISAAINMWPGLMYCKVCIIAAFEDWVRGQYRLAGLLGHCQSVTFNTAATALGPFMVRIKVLSFMYVHGPEDRTRGQHDPAGLLSLCEYRRDLPWISAVTVLDQFCDQC